jgi:arylsulfatase A-like enzyme
MELEDDAFTMARMFRMNGFQSVGFPSVRFLGGMRPGFETYKQDVRIQNRNWHKSAKHQEADQTIDRVIVWLHEERSHDRFFMWIHLFDVHQHSPDQYLQRRYRAQMDALVADESPELMEWLTSNRRLPNAIYEDLQDMMAAYGRYDAQIRFVDDQLERLFGHMDEMGYGANTLWVITSDHGEGLGDHGYGGHAKHLYDEIVQVPAIFYLKGSKLFRGRVDSVVRHVDLLPTLADTIGYRLPNAEAIEGASLLPLLGNTNRTEHATGRLAYAQRGIPKDHRKRPGGQLSSLQTSTAKYILRKDGNDEFYDLENDPLELENAIGMESEEKELLRRRIKEIIADTMGSNPDRRAKTLEEVDPAVIEDLKALGYLDAD